MADTKISDLTAAGSVDGSEVLPMVQSATTKSATLSQVAGLAKYWDTIYHVTGSDFTTTNTSGADDITGLSHAASANSVYEVEAVLVGQSSTTAGVKFGVGFSAAAATGEFHVASNSGTATAAQSAQALNGVIGSSWTTANSDSIARYTAMIRTGVNTGNITIQLGKITSGTATVFIGSVMKVKKLA